MEVIGDRTEGRPVQYVHTTAKRTTIFECAPGEAGKAPQEAAPAAIATTLVSPLDGVTPLEEMRWPLGSAPTR